MKIYDISQQVLSCKVYPGDRTPSLKEDMRMYRGDLYNLSSLEMGAHNGTHVDAPFHFLIEGDTVEKIPVEKTVGYCYVTEQYGDIDREKAKEILSRAADTDNGGGKKILIKGSGVVTLQAAEVFAAAGVDLLGVEGLSAGPEKAPMAVHKVLLKEKVVLLEGLQLAGIKQGCYFLSAAPLSLAGSDGAPCRAVLIDFTEK